LCISEEPDLFSGLAAGTAGSVGPGGQLLDWVGAPTRAAILSGHGSAVMAARGCLLGVAVGLPVECAGEMRRVDDMLKEALQMLEKTVAPSDPPANPTPFPSASPTTRLPTPAPPVFATKAPTRQQKGDKKSKKTLKRNEKPTAAPTRKRKPRPAPGLRAPNATPAPTLGSLVIRESSFEGVACGRSLWVSCGFMLTSAGEVRELLPVLVPLCLFPCMEMFA